MKKYRWNPDDQSVTVVAANGQHTPLKHVFLHSARYDCGNRSSATHELAFSMLADHSRGHGTPSAYAGKFAIEVLASKHQRMHWEITCEEIAAWLSAKREAARAKQAEVKA